MQDDDWVRATHGDGAPTLEVDDGLLSTLLSRPLHHLQPPHLMNCGLPLSRCGRHVSHACSFVLSNMQHAAIAGIVQLATCYSCRCMFSYTAFLAACHLLAIIFKIAFWFAFVHSGYVLLYFSMFS